MGCEPHGQLWEVRAARAVMGGVDMDCAVNIIMNQCFAISN